MDSLEAANILAYGPKKAGAELEGSKAFTKDFLNRHGIPTASYGNFSDADEALAFLEETSLPVVVKASGLAAGKGVIICQTKEEAATAVKEMLSGESFGESGREVVIEEFLDGEETSLPVICSGESYVTLPMSQDHKKAGEGDTGLNTGGMGAYAPTPLVTPEMLSVFEAEIVQPTLAGLRKDGIEFRGTLYVGLMLTPDGPKGLEFNVRFGDPETQVELPRLTSDLGTLLAAAAGGDLAGTTPTFDDGAAVAVVCASEGYPAAPRTGDPIDGLEAASAVDGVTVFAAGVTSERERLVTAGGRVLAVTGQGPTVAEARIRAYEAVSRLSWPGMQHRTDIASSSTGW